MTQFYFRGLTLLQLMKIKTFLVICVFFAGCKSPEKNTARLQSQDSPQPMSCSIEGKIMNILKPTEDDKGTTCYAYPCRATVKILKVNVCGSSVTASPAEGDLVEIKFAHTLHNTKKLFPAMKQQYPGLKKGDEFTAYAEVRPSADPAISFVIYHYEVK
jgi:hypothetical protein